MVVCVCLVLVRELESYHKGTNTHSHRSTLVDEERKSPQAGISVLTFC